MKILQSGILVFMLSLFGLSATAATVDPNAVTTFQSGSALLSSEVNTTINALVTAINDNAAKIATMEAAATAPLDLADRQYCLVSLETGLWVDPLAPVAQPDPGADIGVTKGQSKGGVVLAADGTGVLTLYNDDFKEAFFNFAVIDASEPLGAMPFNWSLNASTLTLDWGAGEIESFVVAKSGEMILGGASYTEGTGSGWFSSNIIVLVEVTDAATTCSTF